MAVQADLEINKADVIVRLPTPSPAIEEIVSEPIEPEPIATPVLERPSSTEAIELPLQVEAAPQMQAQVAFEQVTPVLEGASKDFYIHSQDDPLAQANAQLRSALMSPVDERSSPGNHIPSVEQQMAAQDHQQMQQRGMPPLPPQDGFFSPESFPQFPMFHEPFLGMDGYTYYFDPATGQSVPGPPLPFSAPGFPMDMSQPPSPMAYMPQRRSHKLEIKAPTPESMAEGRFKQQRSKHRQNGSSMTSTASIGRPFAGLEEPLQEMAIPGSVEYGGSIFFSQLQAFLRLIAHHSSFLLSTMAIPQSWQCLIQTTWKHSEYPFSLLPLSSSA